MWQDNNPIFNNREQVKDLVRMQSKFLDFLEDKGGNNSTLEVLWVQTRVRY